MANIDAELYKILNAIYGVDVRDSIHDGIKKINQVVESTHDTTGKLVDDWNDSIESGRFTSTVSVGTTTTGASGTTAKVVNTSTDPQHAKFNFTIPKGDPGSIINATATDIATNTGRNVQVILTELLALSKTKVISIPFFAEDVRAYDDSDYNIPELKVSGMNCELRGVFTVTTRVDNSTGGYICMLPEAYWPSKSITQLCIGGNTDMWLCTIAAGTGYVNISRYSRGGVLVQPEPSIRCPFVVKWTLLNRTDL